MGAFGLGKAFDITGGDINSISAGFYFGSGLAGAPDAGQWGVLCGGGLQFLFSLESPDVALLWRKGTAGVWGGFRSLFDNGNFDPSAYQPNLGFTPVRQNAGGVLEMGWDGGGIAAYQDGFAQGQLFTDSNAHEKIRAHLVNYAAGEIGTYGFFVIGGGSGAAVGPGNVLPGGAIGWSDAAGLMYGNPDGSWRLHGAVRNGDGESPDSTTLCQRIA